ncbi:Rha family transcriptional regulator [Sedimentibacter hydroxybenzoicus DSM 7310]|uniref:Rha family transcriptional regulator n=1 Tax=Sedimentibacter hydroxybenzoicus DSM 7310 TaxID=1123245 RepID=A0A974BIP0_SEDHY|nr:Rha family transcriptional regulator [Sedimentibacter hydroxybenzoicus]NYB73893.1 Rha family transcriptional regulator [Sedimentibacter hydroxybenzoicus DSM 7310]
MNEIQINNQAKTIDSRDIAEMVEMEHKELLRKISSFNEILESAKLRSLDYFVPDTYSVKNNKRKYPCYQFTKMGCEFIANKFTGEKGVIFTAKYVKRFNEMEQAMIPSEMSGLSPQLQLLIGMELKQKQLETALTDTNARIDSIQDAVVVDTQNWRKWINTSINKLAESELVIDEFGDLRYQKVRANTYKELETRSGCNLKQRLKNLKERLEKAGLPKTKILRTSNLEVIEQDKKLKEIYTAIIRNMLIKYQSAV